MRNRGNSSSPRFTGRQITVIAVAAAIAVVAFPVGVFASTGNSVNLADPIFGARKARISPAGHLLTTVDGTVSARPATPARPWRFSAFVPDVAGGSIGPTLSTVNITSLTVSATGSLDATTTFVLEASMVPTTVVTCLGSTGNKRLYYYPSTKGVFTAAFPTPLVAGPNPGKKLCIFVGAENAEVNLSGFLT